MKKIFAYYQLNDFDGDQEKDHENVEFIASLQNTRTADVINVDYDDVGDSFPMTESSQRYNQTAAVVDRLQLKLQASVEKNYIVQEMYRIEKDSHTKLKKEMKALKR